MNRLKFPSFCLFLLCSTLPLLADSITWIGGNGTWSDGAANNSNWNPADEPDPDDIAIFNTSHLVDLGSNNTVLGLTLSNGIDLDTNGFQLTVNGLAQLGGTSTNLFVGGASSVMNAYDVTIQNGGKLELVGGTLNVNEPGALLHGILAIQSGGSLTGNGTINISDIPNAVAPLLINDGTLTALSRLTNILLPPPPGTLTIQGASSLARVDLDGTNESGIVNVNRNQTLNILVPLADTFNGTMSLAHDTTLNISNAWTMGSGATINAQNGAVNGFPAIAAGKSTIAGGAFTQSGGTITVAATDGTLEFTAPFNMSSGNLVNNGLVVFNANATIGSGASFTMPTNTSSITVGAGRQVMINQPSFNLDGNGQVSNVLTVESGGSLVLNLGAAGDSSLSGRMQLRGGTVHVTTPSNAWTIDGTLNVEPNTGISQISGSAVTLSQVNLTIGSNSTLRVAAPLTITSTNNIFGLGTLAFNQQVNVNSTTTLSMSGGTVDLDGTDAAGDLISVNAPLVINAAVLESFGRVNPGGGANGIHVDSVTAGHTGKLTVNLDNPDNKWTLNPQGNLSLSSGSMMQTLLAGSDAILNGSVTALGNVGTTARVELGGVVNLVTPGPNGALRLQGGSLANPNTIAGATINGPGRLQADTNRGLSGYGTIHADIDFGGTATLFAENGTLTLVGAIHDVGQIGAGNNAALHVVNAWNSNVADLVVLNGGEIKGGKLTVGNSNGIVGTGWIAAPVVNNQRITASGGTLVVQTASDNNDWDGTTNTGQLRAVAGGTLEMYDSAPASFAGGMHIVGGSKVRVHGFDLHLEPTSSLILTDGTYQSTNATTISGSLNVTAGAESTMDVAANRFLTFTSSSNTTLHGNLRLINNNINVHSGATFGGAGRLIVAEQSGLIAGTNANMNVMVDVLGTFYPGGLLSVGRVDVKEYQQSSLGTMQVELSGLGLNQFDRMFVSGAAILDGKLQVELLNGFTPTLGNSFTFLTAAAVTGEFSSIIQPLNLPKPLMFDILYSSNIAQLQVLPSGDWNADGQWNCADVNALVAQIAGGSYSRVYDMNGDNVLNGADLSLWLKRAGAANLPSGQPYLPGDANLDGVVDGSDFGIWNANKFTATAAWCSADFNADGIVDGSDFGIWNGHKFTSSNSLQAVPEPGLLWLGLIGSIAMTRWRSSN